MSDLQLPYDRRARTLPPWVPDTQGFLAIAIVLLIAAIALILLVRPPSMDEKTSNVLSAILGILIGCFKDVYSFFFGSSSGSKMLASVVAKSNETRDATIATMGTSLAASTPPAAIVPTTVTETAVHPDQSSTTTTTTGPGGDAAEPKP